MFGGSISYVLWIVVLTFGGYSSYVLGVINHYIWGL